VRTSLRAAIALAIAIGALLVATVASATGPSPDMPVASTPSSPSAKPPGTTCTIQNPDCNDRGAGGGQGTPQIVEPRPGMADVRPTAFDIATIGADDRTLTIVFWSGVEPCAVLDHVDVSYGASDVTVTLYQGSDPSAGQVACPEIAVQKQTTVLLDEPLAGRTIVDGAATPSP